MGDSDTEGATSQRGRFGKAAERLWRWFRVTLGVQPDARRERIRAVTLAVSVAIGFALLGTVRQFSAASFVAGSPIDLDLSLRALSLGWFESERTIPVTIVDIDAATYQGWGSPVITPRDQLTRLLEVVTAAGPAAVVVDIDLSWGDGSSADAGGGQRLLREFLQAYSGSAPLIFPKRVEPAPNSTRRLAASPLDDVFEGNSRLGWAHASFETDGGGAVRSWQDWLEVCTDAGAEWLPAVATRLAAMVETLPDGLDRPTTVTSGRTACGAADGESGGKTKRLLIGPRLTGERRAPLRPDARTIPASLVLDREVARDDAGLFGGRVVFIGATHPSASDFWLTPSGVLPGVELLANTVRFAPLQHELPGWAAQLAYRVAALLLFAVFAYSQWRLRGVAALIVSSAVTVALVAFAIERYDAFRIFDAVEAAILLMILYKALEFALEYVDDVKAAYAKLPPGRWRWLRTLGAAVVREHPPSAEGG